MINTIVWIAILGAFQVFGRKEEQLPCEFNDISQKYTNSCRRKNVETIFKNVLRDGMITDTELHEQLLSTCSKYGSYMLCANCTARHVCPEERTKLRELISEKWALFCDGDQPSDWLRTILQNGYSYNDTCGDAFHNVLSSCMRASPEKEANTSSLKGVSEYYRNIISGYFKCTFDGILSSWLGMWQCGSSWQDILLTNWLQISAENEMWLKISDAEVTQLEAMRSDDIVSFIQKP